MIYGYTNNWIINTDKNDKIIGIQCDGILIASMNESIEYRKDDLPILHFDVVIQNYKIVKHED